VRRRVTRAGREVRLTPKEFELLSFLGRHARMVLTAVCAPSHTQEMPYLRVHIGRLRQKIEQNPDDPRVIVTEPGVGYRIAEIG